jgi:hypothetical protein
MFHLERNRLGGTHALARTDHQNDSSAERNRTFSGNGCAQRAG